MKEKSKKKSKHSKSSKHHKKGKDDHKSAPTPTPTPSLTMDDYFSMNKIFRYYLVSEKKKNFEDFTSVEAHEQFKKFIKLYNKQKLGSVYYSDAIDAEALQQAIKTSHKWNINMTGSEKREIAVVASNAV